jgi:hypothetical protein
VCQRQWRTRRAATLRARDPYALLLDSNRCCDSTRRHLRVPDGVLILFEGIGDDAAAGIVRVALRFFPSGGAGSISGFLLHVLQSAPGEMIDASGRFYTSRIPAGTKFRSRGIYVSDHPGAP